VSGSDDDRSEGEKQTPVTPTPDAPKVEAPKVEAPKVDSIFDSPWGGLGKPVFAAPPVSGFAPPPAKSPVTVPRTSGTEPSVSGEFGKLDEPKPVEPAKAEVVVAQVEEPVAKVEEPVAKVEETAEEPPAEEDPDEAPPLRQHAANTVPPAPSRGWMIILGIAAAVVLLVVYVNSNNENDGEPRAAKPNKARDDSSKPAPRPPQAKTRLGDPTKTGSDKQPDAKVETSGEPAETDTGEPTDPVHPIEPVDPVEPVEPTEPPVEPEPRPKVENPRDPSLIPPGTPAENAKAFSKLPVAPSDGPPLGGIGSTGIHIDQIAMGQGRDNTECDPMSRQFSATGTEYISVCFRAIHPRSQETLRVFWEKDGAVTRRGKVRIPEGLHAYKTRAYLQVRPEYVGSWRVRIVPEGEESIDLGVAEFEVVE
jgi:hypothetical protein